ncbi:MAG: DUF2336 domain-containing protein, partial [Alphaproteobacteria bacterium]
AEAANALARAYLYSDLAEETRSGMEAAMTLLLDDPAPEVRLALCDALASSPQAPRHIIIALAADQPAIAHLALTRSPVLVDAELVDIVAVASADLQMAVAARATISGVVAAALSEVGSRAACHTLLTNPMAALPASALARLARRFGDDPSVRDALLRRAELPAGVHQMLVRQLGDALGGFLVQNRFTAPERAQRVIREACDRATVSIAARADAAAVPALVEHMRVSGQLTTEFLLRAVCSGQIVLFEQALAALTKTPIQRIAGLVRSGRTAAFRAIYLKAGLPESAFAAFSVAVDAWRQVSGRGTPVDRYATTMQIINAVMARYVGQAGGEMSDMASVLRRFAADQARDAARDYALASPATPRGHGPQRRARLRGTGLVPRRRRAA